MAKASLSFFVLFASAILPIPSIANETEVGEFSFSVKPFVSSSNFKYSFDSSGADNRYGNPTSVLDFKDMSSNGVSFLFDVSGKEYYYSTEISIGSKNSSSGKMIDDDYYSGDFVGVNNPTRFSRTISDAEMSKVYYFKFSSGFTHEFDDAFLNSVRYGIGLKGGYNEFVASGLIQAEDPYDFYTGKNGDVIYSKETEVIKIKNYQLLNSFDFFADKKINDFSFSSDISLVYIGYMSTRDYHLMRSDLGGPSFKTNSFVYGFDVGASASYKINSLEFLISVDYSILKPYSYKKTTEVFDSNQNSLGGMPTVSHDFNQVIYSAGASYIF